jgi:hypothetical protein
MKKNKQKFDHYFELLIDVVYVTGFLSVFAFTLYTIVTQ